jgi:hypothetical protein
MVLGGEGMDVKLRRVHPAFVEALDEARERDRRENPVRFQVFGDERDDYDDEPKPRRQPPPIRPNDSWDVDRDDDRVRRPRE